MRENSSYAPLGLADFPLRTHGLRRGLHSYAASRLKPGAEFHGVAETLVLTHTLKARVGFQRANAAIESPLFHGCRRAWALPTDSDETPGAPFLARSLCEKWGFSTERSRGDADATRLRYTAATRGRSYGMT